MALLARWSLWAPWAVRCVGTALLVLFSTMCANPDGSTKAPAFAAVILLGICDMAIFLAPCIAHYVNHISCPTVFKTAYNKMGLDVEDGDLELDFGPDEAAAKPKRAPVAPKRAVPYTSLALIFNVMSAITVLATWILFGSALVLYSYTCNPALNLCFIFALVTMVCVTVARALEACT
jgi:hypothetical protein